MRCAALRLAALPPRDRGAVGRVLHDAHGRSQAELLAAEGVDVGYRGKVTEFATRFFQPSLETTGVIPKR